MPLEKLAQRLSSVGSSLLLFQKMDERWQNKRDFEGFNKEESSVLSQEERTQLVNTGLTIGENGGTKIETRI